MATTKSEQPYYTLAEGVPLPRNDTTNQLLTGSGGGFVLLTSTQMIENLAHFSRERIPERSVHAKASGAWGHYEVTDDISDLTDAAFLNGVGNKTEVLMRISTVGPERGSADTVRDFRGFAVKFKTTEGNNDWVFNNQVRNSEKPLLNDNLILLIACILRPRPRQIPFYEPKSQAAPRHERTKWRHVLGFPH
jgi:catalase